MFRSKKAKKKKKHGQTRASFCLFLVLFKAIPTMRRQFIDLTTNINPGKSRALIMRSVGIQTHGRRIVGGAGTNGSHSKWIHLILWPKFCKMFWGPKCLLTRYNVDSQNDSNFVSFCVEVKMCRKPQILLHYFYWK